MNSDHSSGSKFSKVDDKLKKSFYNLTFEIGQQIVLFNTLKGTVCEVSDDLASALKRNDISSIPNDLILDLKECGFLVSASSDELAEYLRKYEDSKKRDGVLTLMLFLATSCNLGCSYCFQSAPDKPANIIKKEKLNTVLKSIEHQFKSEAVSGVDVQFYGGEPLLARKHLPWFISTLNEICATSGKSSSLSIITNGTLLNERLIDLFVSNRVQMQITLDGGKGIHDQR